jgi:hypothetical protein
MITATVKHERVLRILLVFMGVPGRRWRGLVRTPAYDDFPGSGKRGSVPTVHATNISCDVGELNLALAFITLAWSWCTPLLGDWSSAWLVEGIPHLVYRPTLDPLASDAKVSSIAGLAIVPVVARSLRWRSIAKCAMIDQSASRSSASSMSASTDPGPLVVDLIDRG